MEGRKVGVAKAKELGLVDEVVAASELMSRARRGCSQKAPAYVVKPWDKKGYRLPGAPCRARRPGNCSWARPLRCAARPPAFIPRLPAIMDSVYDGCHRRYRYRIEDREPPFRRGSRFRRRPQNMIRTLFYSIGDANKLTGRPAAVPAAGLSQDRRSRRRHDGRGHRACFGRSRARRHSDRPVAGGGRQGQDLFREAIGQAGSSSGRLTAEKRDGILARITPTTELRRSSRTPIW